MRVRMRSYDQETDYEAVSRFLIRIYQADPPGNWLQPRWIYAHSHPTMDRENLGKIAVWEDDEKIVATVHYEHRMGVNYVQLDPQYPRLKREMLEYAAIHLVGDLKAGRGCYVYIDDEDSDFGVIASEMRFEPKLEHAEPMSRYLVPEQLPETLLPEGFRLQSLADEFDVDKIHRVMHRGFNHQGEPPQEDLEGRRRKLSSPNFRRDLTIVAVAPDGNYASFCGMWPVPESNACYIEPVATDPSYRRMGLGTAVVTESIKRCAAEGANIAYVGSDLPFYLSMGFEVCGGSTAWFFAAREEKP
jgi:predicted N-acetyltransferase YhbS